MLCFQGREFLSFLVRYKWGQLLFFCFSIFLLLYAAVFGLKNLYRYNTFSTEVQNKLDYLARLGYINRGYKKELQALSLDEYWIVLAKKKLGYVKQGETIYKFY